MEEIFPNLNQGPSGRYRPKGILIRLLFCVAASHLIVIHGDERPIPDILFSKTYYIAFLTGTIIVYVFFVYLHFVNRKLDQRQGWETSPVQRALYQFFLALFLPAATIAVAAWFYFSHTGAAGKIIHFLRNDLPFTLVTLSCLNLYYVVLYLVSLVNKLKAGQTSGQPPRGPAAEHSHEIFLVHTALRTIPVRAESIAYFFRKNGHNFVRTFTGETYTIHEPLRELEDRFTGIDFFRINRQMIISINAFESYQSGKNKTLDLVLKTAPFFPNDNRKKENNPIVTVSEDRVQSFKEWINR